MLFAKTKYLLLFVLIITSILSNGQKDTTDHWNYMVIPSDTTSSHCWKAIQVKGDEIYNVRVENQIMYFSYSVDHGKTWKHDIVENINKYNLLEDRQFDVSILSVSKGEGSPKKTTGKMDLSRAGFGVFARTGFKVDKNNCPHIVYTIDYSGDLNSSSWLKYATRDSLGIWSVTTIAAGRGKEIDGSKIERETDLIIDENQNIHVVYVNRDNVMHAFSTSGKSWRLTKIDQYDDILNGGKSGTHTTGVALEIDKKGQLHIVYDRMEEYMGYATSVDQGRTWNVKRIKVPVDLKFWGQCDLTIDDFDRPHVVYSDVNTANWHGVKQNGKWVFNKVTGPDTEGRLLFDSRGVLHLVSVPIYYKTSHMYLDYYYSCDYGKTWVNERINHAMSSYCTEGYVDVVESNDRIYINYQTESFKQGVTWRNMEARYCAEVERMDFVLYNDPPPIVEQPRSIELVKQIPVSSDSIKLYLFDRNKLDGDVVSLMLNGTWIIKNHKLKKSRKKINVILSTTDRNFLTVYSDNVGKYQRNTVSLLVISGKDKKLVHLNSDLDNCEAVELVLNKKEKQCDRTVVN